MNEAIRTGGIEICSLSRNWWVFALRGALALVIAVLAALMPAESLLALTIVFGAFAFVDGIFGLIAAYRRMREGEKWGWLAFSGAVGVLTGIVVVLLPLVATFALSLFLWWSIVFWAIVSGVLELMAAIRLRKEIRGEIWLAASGILSIALGAVIIWLLFTRPIETFIALGWVIAFYAAIFGVMMLLLAWRLRRGDIEGVVAVAREG